MENPYTTGPDAVEKLREMIKDIDIAMFTTQTLDGRMRSRPMATQKDDLDGEHLWFFTWADSPKVDEFQDDADVNLSYADPKGHRYVSITGKATLVRDRMIMESLWNPLYKAWFPDGLQDPNLALIRVDVDEAEYWDSPGLVRGVLGFVKSLLTDDVFDEGENQKVILDDDMED